MWNDVNLSIIVNQKAIKLFGLEAAAYFAVITQIVPRVMAKQTADEKGFFPIDRHYVEEQCGLDLEHQYHCDSILVKSGILCESAESRDRICVDLKRYFSVLTEMDPKILDDIKKKAILSKTALEKDASNARAAKKAEERAEKAKLAEIEKAKREEKKKLDAERKEEKEKAIKNLMENHARTQFAGFSEEIQNQIVSWVDSVLEGCQGGNFLTYPAINVFCQQIKDFSKNDFGVISKLLNIAIAKSYKDAGWVINSYNSQMKSGQFQSKPNSAVNPGVPQKIANENSVDLNIVF